MNKCPSCERTTYMHLSKCRKCGTVFCDSCEEVAAELADTIEHSSESITMYQPVCVKCGSREIDIGTAK
jgi:hypothetical protein